MPRTSRRNSYLCQRDDEIEVDIDVVDVKTLWELDRFVTYYKKSLRKKKKVVQQSEGEAGHYVQEVGKWFKIDDKDSMVGEGWKIFQRMMQDVQQFLRVFFSVRKIDDPIGLLPGRIILGINKCGVYFFHPVPKEYLHSADLRDVMQFGSNNTAFVFKMRVAGGESCAGKRRKLNKEICGASLSEGVFVGFFLSMSSTAVVLKFWVDNNSNSALHGQVTIGTLIFQVWETQLSEAEKSFRCQFLLEGTNAKEVMQALVKRESLHFGNPFMI
ncbi:hypothetical protein IFM89_027647 [Coptis chinensis]|uniref:NET domain-containing protein n=1 Tax=Coptis chinensis TaxID=261450 RepID=A0A835MAY8_9MAGN|nr:hypothetical protein IFM89_027647 [Coptis chinensis]